MTILKGFRASTLSRFAGGLTLVEFAVSLGIVSVGLTQAVPSFEVMVANSQVTAANNALLAGMNQARSSAITLGQDISICSSSDAASCAANSWKDGWIVFNDLNENGNPDTDEVIRVNSQDGNLSNQGFGNPIVFRPNGTTALDVDATIVSCYANPETEAKCSYVTVGAYGMVSAELRAYQ